MVARTLLSTVNKSEGCELTDVKYSVGEVSEETTRSRAHPPQCFFVNESQESAAPSQKSLKEQHLSCHVLRHSTGSRG